MNIDEMNDQEKSVLLARAMDDPGLMRAIISLGAEHWSGVPDFYDPANMALAWRVLNWVGTWSQRDQWIAYTSFCGFWDANDLWVVPPAEAQCLWLDKILELAIEVGLIEGETA